LLYRRKKAMQIVSERRLQSALETALKLDQRFKSAIVAIQRIRRMVVVRRWFRKYGYFFYPLKKDAYKVNDVCINCIGVIVHKNDEYMDDR